MSSNKILIFLVCTTLGFLNVETQEATEYPFANSHDLSGIWHVMNATGLEAGPSVEPRCWCIAFFKFSPNHFKGFSFYLDNKTNEHTSLHINAVQHPDPNKIIFQISPVNPKLSTVKDFYLRLDDNDYVSYWSKLETAESEEPVGHLEITEDLYSLVNNTIWAGCGDSFDYSQYTEEYENNNDINTDIPELSDNLDGGLL